MNERYLSTIPVLKEISVVTPGDIFPHNVIWKSVNQPFLIEWEAVKKWNPTREIIRTCATWGGVGNEPFSLSLFELMLNSYTNYGGHIERNHVEAALNGMYGNIINWLLYNIDLLSSCDNRDRNDHAISHINACLASASKLTEIYPILSKSILNTSD